MLVYKWTPYFLSLNWFLRFTICINELTAVRQDGSAFSGGGITAWQWHLRNAPNGTLMYWHVLHIKTLLFLIPLTARNVCLITNICLSRSVLPLRKLSSDEFSYFNAVQQITCNCYGLSMLLNFLSPPQSHRQSLLSLMRKYFYHRVCVNVHFNWCCTLVLILLLYTIFA